MNARRAAGLALGLALLAHGRAAATAGPADARPAPGLPSALRDVGIDQRLGEALPLGVRLTDEEGREVALGELLGARPVVLAFAYYRCPMLCNQVLAGLVTSLGQIAFDAGEQYDVVVVSIDPTDTSEQAAARKRSLLARYRRPGTEAGWHTLTAPPETIEALTRAAGFRYAYDAATDQFAHASGVIVVTPDGRLARYFYGIEYAPTDMRLALVEASGNRIGSPVDRLMLYCFRYDPTTGRYGAVVMNLVRIGALVTLAALALLIVLLRRRELWRRRGAELGSAS